MTRTRLTIITPNKINKNAKRKSPEDSNAQSIIPISLEGKNYQPSHKRNKESIIRVNKRNKISGINHTFH